jgi:hypothetical protein
MEKIYRLVDRKRRPCPVCNNFFKRERIMILAETNQGNFYICQSNIWEDFPCGFRYSEEATEEEIKEKARERINYLAKLSGQGKEVMK